MIGKNVYMNERVGNDQILILRKRIVSRMGSHFPNRWPLSYPNETKI